MHSSDHMEPQLQWSQGESCDFAESNQSQEKGQMLMKHFLVCSEYAPSRTLHFDVVHVKALCKSFCRRSARSSLVSGAFGWKRSSCMMPAWQGLHQFSSSSQVWKPKPNSSQLECCWHRYFSPTYMPHDMTHPGAAAPVPEVSWACWICCCVIEASCHFMIAAE